MKRKSFNINNLVLLFLVASEREEIGRVIKNLLVGQEGEGIRQRMKKLKGAAADALKDDGSSSTMTLTQLALKWKNLSLGVA